MDGTRQAKTTLDSTLELIGDELREEGEIVFHEELPERWVELILYLEEKERRDASRPPKGDA
jgi:hypothetical protein